MNDLPRRSATALVYGAAMLAGVLHPYAAAIVLGVVLVVGLRELAKLAPSAPWLGAAVGLQLGVGVAALLLLSARGPGGLLIALLPTWAADVAAYGAGSLWGSRKLAPRISPGKTWEGTIAGLVAAAVVAMAVAAWLSLPTVAMILLSIIGVVGLAGDLLESMLKRAAGVKDSGTLLPGHGGMLDRVDSLLLVAPFVVLVLVIATRSAVG